MSAVSIGIALPVRENAILGSNDAAPLLKMSQQVETLGYDSVWAGDSFVARHRLEPLTLLAAIAMVTDRITIGTAALTAVLREPVALGQIIVTLDQLSTGRLRLGIGTGAPLPVKSERDAVTMSYRERADRVDEMVRGWKMVWNDEDGDLAGKYYNLEGLRAQSPPLQVGGPALWLASNGKPDAVRRVVERYDGWMPVQIGPEDYASALVAIREKARTAGRDPDSISPTLYITVNTDEDADEAVAGLDKYTHRYNGLPLTAMTPYQLYFGGSTEAFVTWLGEYAKAGARHFILRIGSFENYEQQVLSIADGVLPSVHAFDLG